MGFFLRGIKNHVLESKAEFCTADYGSRQRDYPDHHGIDIVNGYNGTCGILAIADGEVVHIQTGVVGYNEILSAGNYVRIKHENGYYSRYLHLAEDSICVKVGQKVKAGDVIGIEGGTGFCIPAGAVHLHFDINDGTRYIDPLPYLLGEKTFSTRYENNEILLKVGDKVTVKAGARFSSGSEPYDHVYTTTYIVQQVSKNGLEALIGINGMLIGWMYVKDLNFVNKTKEEGKFEVGNVVKVKAGATSYQGKQLASFVYTQKYTVIQVGIEGADDYIVIGQNGQVTAAIKADDLILLQ